MNDIRLCLIGDSFVNGTGDPECLGWAGRVCCAAQAKGYGITYYNLGVRRETSADIAARWQREVACRLSTTMDGRLIFSLGVNDTTLEKGRLRVTPEASVGHLHQILQTSRQSFPVLMVGPPAIADPAQNQRIAELSLRFAAVCEALDIPYLDTFTPLSTSNQWMEAVQNGDGAHPGAEGYQLLANLIQNWPAWLAWFP